MTKKDVRDAYAPIAPTPEQKEKMWNAIQSERDQRPVQTTKLVRPEIFRSRVRSAIAAVASLAAVLAVIVWIWPEKKSTDTTVEMAEAQAADEAMPESDEEAALGMGTPEFGAAENAEDSAALYGASAYDDVLETYRTALAESWTAQQCADAGISPLAAATADTDTGEIGYYLTDLDGDGTEELLISDGSCIYNLYAMRDGAAESIAESTAAYGEESSVTCWLCEDNIIFLQSNGASQASYMAYRVSGGYLVAQQQILYAPETYPDAPWRLGFNEDACTEQDANIAIAAYKQVEIPVTPLTQ